ncbi:MAG: hypothetical protein TREMPRED_000294, partial [Tremellales sp. Tagirdzhanova-0007]
MDLEETFEPELEVIAASLLPAEALTSSEPGIWPWTIEISSTDSKLSLCIVIAQGYPAQQDVAVEVKGTQMGRDEAEGWREWVSQKMGQWNAEEGYPLYQLLTMDLLPLLAPASPSPPSSPPHLPHSAPPLVSHHILLTSHHLLSRTKRKDLLSLSSQLSLTGFSKTGHPGIMYAIGERDDLVEWLREVKSWNWLALRVRVGAEPVVSGLMDEGKGKGAGARGGKGRGEWLEVEKINDALEWLRVLEYLLVPLDLTKYPETFGPKDDDPLVPLIKYLKQAAPAEEAVKGWTEELKMPTSSIKIAAKMYMAYKKMKQAKGGVRILQKQVDHPFPLLSRPFEPMLSSHSLRETPYISNSKGHHLPKALHDLSRQAGLDICFTQLTVKEMEEGIVNIDQVLAVDGLEFEPDDVNKANAFAAALKQTLRELIGLASIPASEHPVWEAWGSQSLLTLKQSFPRPITPPLLPANAPPDPKIRPVDYRQVRYSFAPAIPDSMKTLDSLLASATKEISPHAVLGSVGSYLQNEVNARREDLDNPLALRHLDEFDESPFEPMTPTTKASRPSEATRSIRRPLQADLPITPLSRRAFRRVPWEEDIAIAEPPLMPWKHELFTRTLPIFQSLPVSSPSYPSSHATSERETQGLTDDATVMRYHQPSLFGRILKPERYSQAKLDNELWSRIGSEAVEFGMEDDFIMSGGCTMKVPSVRTSIKRDSKDLSPATYADILGMTAPSFGKDNQPILEEGRGLGRLAREAPVNEHIDAADVKTPLSLADDLALLRTIPLPHQKWLAPPHREAVLTVHRDLAVDKDIIPIDTPRRATLPDKVMSGDEAQSSNSPATDRKST